MDFQTVNASASPEVQMNENFETINYASVYGKRQPVTSALTWGYYGGRWSGFAVAEGTLTLTNAATNYVVVLRSTGAISVSTSSTNWDNTALYARVYKITTAGGVVTVVEDHRAGTDGVHGDTSGSVSIPKSLADAAGDTLEATAADTWGKRAAKQDMAAHATTMNPWAARQNVMTGSAVTVTDIADAPYVGAVAWVKQNAAHVWDDGAVFDVQGGADYTAAADDWILIYATTVSTFQIIIFPAAGSGGIPATLADAAGDTVEATGADAWGKRVAKQDLTAHATTMDPWGARENVMTGTAVTITDIADADYVGQVAWIKQNAAHIWTDGAVFDIQGNANYTAEAGDWVRLYATSVSTFELTVFKWNGTGLEEYVSSAVTSGSAVSLTSGAVSNVTSITLGIGDWDVEGVVAFTGGATTTVSYQLAGISTASASISTADQGGYNGIVYNSVAIFSLLTAPALSLTRRRITVTSGTTTMYLCALSGFAVSTQAAHGLISARKVSHF